MQFSTFFTTIFAAATVASAAAIPSTQPALNERSNKIVYQDGIATWYGADSLQDPACGGPTPNDDSLVVATSTASPFSCGTQLHVHYNNRMVPVSVVDNCAACQPHQIDCTKGVFQALGASLDEGELHNVHLVSNQ